MQLRIDQDLCTGHGRCYTIAPELFEPDEYGNSQVLPAGEDVPAELAEKARLAVANCPERAIAIEE